MNEPASPPRYTLSPEGAAIRAAIRDEWHTERATRGHELIASLPVELQGMAFRAWMALEQLHGQQTRELQLAWMQECERAYLAGQQRELDRAQASMEGRTDGPEAPQSDTIH